MIKPGIFPYPSVAASSAPSLSPGLQTARSTAWKEKCTARSRYLRIFAGAILLVFLLSVPHVSAGTTVTIDNSSSIADALLNVGSGGTLILLPGTYFIGSEIVLSNSTTIKASEGHGFGDTIINARDSCRIINNSGGYSLAIEGLTLRNGMVTGTAGGGAIYAGPGSTVTVTSSRFFNCSAYNGGAINITGGDSLSVTGSEFLNCSGYDRGAAIYSITTRDVTISESGFTDCAACWGTVYLELIDNTVTIASSNFTRCSGTIVCGAVYLSGSTATITGSTFTGCFGNLEGGAIYATNSPLNVESSTFTNCTTNDSNSYGGAIYSTTKDVTVTGSTFTGCSAAFDGGGIYADSGKVSVTSSTFTRCWVYYEGGGIYSSSGKVSVTSSTFTGCTAYLGGGGISTDSGNVSITSSTFTGCRAKDGNGGAVYCGATGSSGSVTVTGSVFEDCTASYYSIIYTTFSGGAIFSDCCNTIMCSTFTNCSAYSGGGAVFGDTNSTGSIHFSRIYNCSSGGTAVSSLGSMDATNNWWATNDDPSGFVSVNVTVDPWLVLGGTASPLSVTTSQTSIVRGNLNYNSDGEDKSGSGHVPDGIAAVFAVTGGSGTVLPLTGTTTDGAAATTFTPTAAGDATISITVDGVSVFVPVAVNNPSSSGTGGSNTNTGVGASQNLKAGQSASFTFEGKGAVEGLSVTVGEDTPKIMVTVKSRSSLPSDVNEPGNVVYEYEEVTEYFVDSSDITGGEFGFRVSKSWLESEGYSLEDIMMLHYNDETGEWEELETTFVREEGGYYYYTADTPSFSWFAIAVEEGATIVPEGTTQAVSEAIVTAGKTAASTTTAAGTPSETVVVVDSDDSGENSSWNSLIIPVVLVVLVAIGIAGLIIRKKKEEYPDWWNKELK